MNIALLSDTFKMPNLALMKISAYHKQKNDNVSIFNPLFAHEYDKVYYSKIFTFTRPCNSFLNNLEKGGTGFDITKKLPDYIDDLKPDYNIYPNCDYAIGFLTRGCIRKCQWYVVPQKEGYIKPYNTIEQIARHDSDKVILFDNNALALEFGISQIEKLAESYYKIDFNQGLDARLITPDIAKVLAKIKWLRYIRVSSILSKYCPLLKKPMNIYAQQDTKRNSFATC